MTCDDSPYTLVLLRHGESDWNAKNLFTGWVDVALSDKGAAEAVRGGELLARAPACCRTWCTPRCCGARSRTANLALDACGPALDPGAPRLAAQRAALRRAAGQGQEADAGASTARSSSCSGAARTTRRRRRSTTTTSSARPATRATPTSAPSDARAPSASRTSSPGCCRTGTTRSSPDLRAGKTVLVAAHGNSLRALVKHLDGISDEDIAGLNIPTGIPLRLRAGRRPAPTARGGRVPRPRGRRRRHRRRGQPGSLTPGHDGTARQRRRWRVGRLPTRHRRLLRRTARSLRWRGRPPPPPTRRRPRRRSGSGARSTCG